MPVESSVGMSVGACVEPSVAASVGVAVGASVEGVSSEGMPVQALVGSWVMCVASEMSVEMCVAASVEESVAASVEPSVATSVGASAKACPRFLSCLAYLSEAAHPSYSVPLLIKMHPRPR